jgi:hypothetical protein
LPTPLGLHRPPPTPQHFPLEPLTRWLPMSTSAQQLKGVGRLTAQTAVPLDLDEPVMVLNNMGRLARNPLVRTGLATVGSGAVLYFGTQPAVASLKAAYSRQQQCTEIAADYAALPAVAPNYVTSSSFQKNKEVGLQKNTFERRWAQWDCVACAAAAVGTLGMALSMLCTIPYACAVAPWLGTVSVALLAVSIPLVSLFGFVTCGMEAARLRQLRRQWAPAVAAETQQPPHAKGGVKQSIKLRQMQAQRLLWSHQTRLCNASAVKLGAALAVAIGAPLTLTVSAWWLAAMLPGAVGMMWAGPRLEALEPTGLEAVQQVDLGSKTLLQFEALFKDWWLEKLAAVRDSHLRQTSFFSRVPRNLAQWMRSQLLGQAPMPAETSQLRLQRLWQDYLAKRKGFCDEQLQYLHAKPQSRTAHRLRHQHLTRQKDRLARLQLLPPEKQLGALLRELALFPTFAQGVLHSPTLRDCLRPAMGSDSLDESQAYTALEHVPAALRTELYTVAEAALISEGFEEERGMRAAHLDLLGRRLAQSRTV